MMIILVIIAIAYVATMLFSTTEDKRNEEIQKRINDNLGDAVSTASKSHILDLLLNEDIELDSLVQYYMGKITHTEKDNNEFFMEVLTVTC